MNPYVVTRCRAEGTFENPVILDKEMTNDPEEFFDTDVEANEWLEIEAVRWRKLGQEVILVPFDAIYLVNESNRLTQIIKVDQE